MRSHWPTRFGRVAPWWRPRALRSRRADRHADPIQQETAAHLPVHPRGKTRLKQVLVGGGGLEIFPDLNAFQPSQSRSIWTGSCGSAPAEWRPYNETSTTRRLGPCISFVNLVSPDMTAHTFDLAQSGLGMGLTGPVEIHPHRGIQTADAHLPLCERCGNVPRR